MVGGSQRSQAEYRCYPARVRDAPGFRFAKDEPTMPKILLTPSRRRSSITAAPACIRWGIVMGSFAVNRQAV